MIRTATVADDRERVLISLQGQTTGGDGPLSAGQGAHIACVESVLVPGCGQDDRIRCVALLWPGTSAREAAVEAPADQRHVETAPGGCCADERVAGAGGHGLGKVDVPDREAVMLTAGGDGGGGYGQSRSSWSSLWPSSSSSSSCCRCGRDAGPNSQSRGCRQLAEAREIPAGFHEGPNSSHQTTHPDHSAPANREMNGS
nr:hypothetical protein CFP56_07926 [Quercus suber]